eukprot:5918215-Amphidinium_carterae.3
MLSTTSPLKWSEACEPTPPCRHRVHVVSRRRRGVRVRTTANTWHRISTTCSCHPLSMGVSFLAESCTSGADCAKIPCRCLSAGILA